LNPKKYKDILKKTSEELDIEQKIVKTVTDFYWDKARKSLSSLENPHVFIDGLGTFNIKWDILQTNIQRYSDYLQNRENLVFSRYHVYKNTVDKLEKMQALEITMKEEYEKKKNHRENKKQQNNDSLEQ
jgi:hypothetical protein